jgi:hypothetical protein
MTIVQERLRKKLRSESTPDMNCLTKHVIGPALPSDLAYYSLKTVGVLHRQGYEVLLSDNGEEGLSAYPEDWYRLIMVGPN